MDRALTTRHILVLALVLGALVFSSTSSYAQSSTSFSYPTPRSWDDRSDELPGISSGKTVRVLGIAAAGLLTTALIVRLSNNNKRREHKQPAQSQPDSVAVQQQASSRSQASVLGSESPLQRLEQDARALPVNVFVGLGREGFSGSDRALTVGATIRF